MCRLLPCFAYHKLNIYHVLRQLSPFIRYRSRVKSSFLSVIFIKAIPDRLYYKIKYCERLALQAHVYDLFTGYVCAR